MAASFTELYEGAAPAVYAWASLHIRNPLRSEVEPEDVLQEVACRAYAGFDGFDPERGEFRSWLFGIARNVLHQALERLASRSGKGSIDLTTGELHALPDAATTISRRVARDESLTRFLEEVDALPDEDRQLIVYRGLEGLPHDEVARLLGVSPETSAKRWQRLRERLRADAALTGLLAA